MVSKNKHNILDESLKIKIIKLIRNIRTTNIKRY